jgi:hypothetical protein
MLMKAQTRERFTWLDECWVSEKDEFETRITKRWWFKLETVVRPQEEPLEALTEF